MALVDRLLFYHQTLRDLKRVINCDRGVASVANCAYPLRYLASRFSLDLTQCPLHLLSILKRGTSFLISYIEFTPLFKFKMASVEAPGALRVSRARGTFQSHANPSNWYSCLASEDCAHHSCGVMLRKCPLSEA